MKSSPFRKKYILMVLEATLGGTRKYVCDLLQGIDFTRYHVTLIYSTKRADTAFVAALKEYRDNPSIELIHLPMVREVSPLRDFYCLFRLWWFLLSRRFDLVHCHSSKAGFLARLATKFSSPFTPTVYSPNAMAVHIHPVYKYIEKFAALFTTKIIASSQSEKQEILDHKIISENKIELIDLGVTLPTVPNSQRLREILHLSPEVKLAVCVARCTEQKNPLDFFRAAQWMQKNNWPVHFCWLGNGELEREAKQAIEQWQLKNATFIGNRPDTQELLSGADIFVLTSLYESFGYVTCEAMAWGLPVVATDVMGTRDLVVEGQTGFLVPLHDIETLSNRILQLASDADLRHRMGEEGKRRVEDRFSTEKMVASTVALYEQLTTKKSSILKPASITSHT